MKKVIFSRLFFFILGAILFSGITVLAYKVNSDQVSYTPNNSNWQVDNVESAINDLYSSVKRKQNFLLCANTWTNNGKGGASINLNNFDYRYIELNNLGYKEGSTATVYFTDAEYNPVETELNKEYDRNNSNIAHLYITEQINSSYGYACVNVKFYNK